jgi:CHAD domain-containing protein
MEELEIYSENRKRALNLILQKAPEKYTVETFHELRVEIKKVKALFELIAFCYKKFKLKKTFRPFRIIFKAAGKVRELQLQQIILEELRDFQLLKKYPSQLKKLENKKIKKFFYSTNKRLVKKLRAKYLLIICLISKIPVSKINRYRTQITNEKKKLIQKKRLKKKQIHDFRKRLKICQYTEKIFRADKPNNLISDTTVLSDLLGEWHDYEVVDFRLKKAIASYKSYSKERAHLINSKASVTLKRELLLFKINATLQYQTL